MSNHTVNMMYLQLWSMRHCRSQGPQLESAHWHHPTSARQPHDAATVVRSESHRPPFASLCIISDLTVFTHNNSCQSVKVCILNCAHCVIVILSGTSIRISSLAPSLLSSATSRCFPVCTLRIASPSINICQSVYNLSFDIIYNICFDIFVIICEFDASPILLIASLSLCQGPLRESAQRYHPT